MSAGATTAAAGISSSLTAAMPTFQPWWDLLNPAALSLPPSLSDATTRLFQNLTHFSTNYAAVFLLILFLRLFFHPAAIVALLVVLAAWAFFLTSRSAADEPLAFSGISVGDGVVLAGLSFVTVVAVVWTGVFWNVFVSGLIGGLVLGLHAVLRSTDDLVSDDRASPYGELVGPGDSQGTYTIL